MLFYGRLTFIIFEDMYLLYILYINMFIMLSSTLGILEKREIVTKFGIKQ